MQLKGEDIMQIEDMGALLNSKEEDIPHMGWEIKDQEVDNLGVEVQAILKEVLMVDLLGAEVQMLVEAIEVHSFGQNSEAIVDYTFSLHVILLNANVFSLKLLNHPSMAGYTFINSGINHLLSTFCSPLQQSYTFFLHLRFFFFLAGLQTQEVVFPYGCQAYMQQPIQPTDLGGAYARYSITVIQMPTMSPPTT